MFIYIKMLIFVMFIYSKHTPPLMYKRRHPPWRCCEAIFYPLSWLSCWLFFFCFKHCINRHVTQIYQSCIINGQCWKVKGQRSCYKVKLCPNHLLLISKGAQIVISCWAVVIHNFKKLNVALLVFVVRMAWCVHLHKYGLVELSSMRLIKIWTLSSTFLMLILQCVCPVFKFQRSA